MLLANHVSKISRKLTHELEGSQFSEPKLSVRTKKFVDNRHIESKVSAKKLLAQHSRQMFENPARSIFSQFN